MLYFLIGLCSVEIKQERFEAERTIPVWVAEKKWTNTTKNV